MSIAVRELGIADTAMLEELLDAIEPGWSDGLAPGANGPTAFITEPRTFVFGGYVDNEPAGWLWGLHMRRPDGRTTTHVHQIDVVAEYRRRGVAQALVEAALALAERTGSYRMWLTTDQANEPAKALYEKAGARRRTEQGEIVYSWPF